MDTIMTKKEANLLATHISSNEAFESACLAGDSAKIIEIVNFEMAEHKLYSKGAKKLCNDIITMLNGKAKVTYYKGTEILSFVWNSRLSGTGLAVC